MHFVLLSVIAFVARKDSNSLVSIQPQNRKLRKPIEIFDIKAFVSEKKKQRLEKLMAQMDDDDDDIISF